MFISINHIKCSCRGEERICYYTYNKARNYLSTKVVPVNQTSEGGEKCSGMAGAADVFGLQDIVVLDVQHESVAYKWKE